ncbi:unnamed protein product [Closterium sp. Naga37s-1]|nr:unnamed protein product [Closterium sp. Naga37s-1]
MAYPPIVSALGAGRQREKDVFASMLVQILGVKENRDLEQGFGAAMQNLLSGGLEKAHAEKKVRAGRGVVGGSKGKRQMENDGNLEGSWESTDGGGKDGRDGKGGQWREHLKGVCGRGMWMAWLGFWSMEGGKGGSSGAATAVRGPAAAAAIWKAGIFRRAFFTYRAACILKWARTYGSEVIPASQCCKDSPQGKVRPMRHPLRDLPSLLVRLGAIPKPVDQGSFSWEWDEWPQGDETVVKLPDDPSARFFRLGIVEEASGTAEECGAGEKGGQGSSGPGPKAGSKMGAGREHRGGKGMGKLEGSIRGHGKEERIRGLTSEDQRGLHRLLTDLLPLVQRKYPIVRCTADAEFLVEFAGCMIKPPACAQCKQCFALFNHRIPFLGVVANYAYRPASILFNRFVSIFPPHSQQFNHLTGLIGLPPFPASVPGFLRSPVVQAQAEQVPVVFLLQVAYNWPLSILGIGDLQHFHRREWEEEQEGLGARRGGEEVEEEEEEDGRVWEEVRTWCLAVLSAWAGSWKLAVRGLGGTCKGKKQAGQEGLEGGVYLTEWGRELWIKAMTPRPATASPAAPSTSAAPATPAGHSSPAPSSTPPAPPAVATSCTAPVSVTGGSGSAACGRRVCGAARCGTVEGGGVKLKNCSGCGKVAYCSRECQKAHWPSHKLTCPGRTSGRGGGSSGKVSGTVSETRWQQQGVWQGEWQGE